MSRFAHALITYIIQTSLDKEYLIREAEIWKFIADVREMTGDHHKSRKCRLISEAMTARSKEI